MKPKINPNAFTRKQFYIIAWISEMLEHLFRFYAEIRIGIAISPPRKWHRVLIVGDNHLGDVLLRTSFLPVIRRELPEAELCYLTSPTSSPLLHGNPNLDTVLPYAETDSPFDISSEYVDQLRNMNFDSVLITNSTRYWPYLLFSLRIGIPNRVSYAHKGFSGFITHPIIPQFPASYAAYFRDYGSQLFHIDPVLDIKPQLFLNNQDEDEALNAWSHSSLVPQRPVMAVFCTSRESAELWALDKWAECVRLIAIQRTDIQVVFLGASSDSHRLSQVAKATGGSSKIMAGTLSVRGLASFLKRCAIILTPDSGPRHVGNAVGTPVVYIRNLAVIEEELAPYCKNEVDVAPHGSRLSPKEQRAVLSGIIPESVCKTVLAHMRPHSLSPG